MQWPTAPASVSACRDSSAPLAAAPRGALGACSTWAATSEPATAHCSGALAAWCTGRPWCRGTGSPRSWRPWPRCARRPAAAAAAWGARPLTPAASKLRRPAPRIFAVSHVAHPTCSTCGPAQLLPARAAAGQPAQPSAPLRPRCPAPSSLLTPPPLQPHVDSYDYFLGEGMHHVIDGMDGIEIENPLTCARRPAACCWFWRRRCPRRRWCCSCCCRQLP